MDKPTVTAPLPDTGLRLDILLDAIPDQTTRHTLCSDNRATRYGFAP